VQEWQLIQTALLNVAQQLADMTASPKPTYSVDGKSVSWGEHFNNLLASQQKLREQLQKAQGPFTLTSVAR